MTEYKHALKMQLNYELLMRFYAENLGPLFQKWNQIEPDSEVLQQTSSEA
jgi:hypothetical protein